MNGETDKPLTAMDFRKRLGLTQEQMAQRMKCSVSTVAKTEAGRAPRVYPWEIPEYLEKYACTLEEFVSAWKKPKDEEPDSLAEG